VLVAHAALLDAVALGRAGWVNRTSPAIWLFGAPAVVRRAARERALRFARLSSPEEDSVKKLLLLLIVVALGAAIAKKVRAA
jgi:hypothetical protein